MDEDGLRGRLEKTLRRKVPSEIWDQLRKERFLEVKNEHEWNDLRVRARGLLSLQGKRAKRSRVRQRNETKELSPVLGAHEKLRSLALSEYFSRLAALEPAINRFRRIVMDDALLSESDALALIGSPAAARFSAIELKDLNVPFIHRAEVLETDWLEGDRRRDTVRINPPGVDLEFSSREPFLRSVSVSRDGNVLLYVRHPGGDQKQPCWRGSLLDELGEACRALESFPWRKGSSAWFVLTGVMPRFDPMLISRSVALHSHHERVTFTLTVDHWVSAASVARMYRRGQKQLLEQRNRSMGDHRLQLFRFITANTNEAGTLPKWRPLMDQWNRKSRSKPYQDVRNFARDYRSAERMLLFPDVVLGPTRKKATS